MKSSFLRDMKSLSFANSLSSKAGIIITDARMACSSTFPTLAGEKPFAQGSSRVSGFRQPDIATESTASFGPMAGEPGQGTRAV